MKQRFLKIILAIIILICFYWIVKIIYIDPSLDSKNPLNPDLVDLQTYKIDSKKDTILIGAKGTLIKIDKNTFIDCKGNSLSGKITIQLKEFYSPRDIVISGLSTTSNGDILETGGMIYLMATLNNQRLCINDSNKLGIIIPSDKYKRNMRLYNGSINKESQSINWTNPIELLNDTVVKIDLIKQWDQDMYTLEEAFRLGMMDSSSTALGSGNKFFDDFINDFYASYDLNNKLTYIFETVELGWLNIDRLMAQTDTKTVTFNARVKNSQPFNTIFVKVLFPELGIYLTAYNLRDGRFVLGKDFTNKVNLPLDAKGYLLATSYYKRKPYYSLIKLKIKEQQSIEIKLSETTEAKLKELIETEF